MNLWKIKESELEYSAIRASGPGGQHVNKVSTAVQLRFDINASTMAEELKQKLLAWDDNRISKSGVVVIKAQRYRSQEFNKQDALLRLQQLVDRALACPAKRYKTKPTRSSVEKRLTKKEINVR